MAYGERTVKATIKVGGLLPTGTKVRTVTAGKYRSSMNPLPEAYEGKEAVIMSASYEQILYQRVARYRIAFGDEGQLPDTSVSADDVIVLPFVGCPMTFSIGSDSYGGYVNAVSRTGHRVETTKGTAIRQKDGSYRAAGRGGYYSFGTAVEYMDPSF